MLATAHGGTASHTCDGTYELAEPAPGPTATGALDDAARLGGFTIDGPLRGTRLSTTTSSNCVADQQIDPNTAFWSLWINLLRSLDKGGCQKRVLAGPGRPLAGHPSR